MAQTNLSVAGKRLGITGLRPPRSYEREGKSRDKEAKSNLYNAFKEGVSYYERGSFKQRERIQDMKGFVYHCSTIQGLTEILPKKSSHGIPYVYAAYDMHMSLIFAVNKKYAHGDFSLGLGRNILTKKVYVCERLSGAFKDSYKNVRASLYVLPKKGFEERKTPWEEEVVSPLPVKPDQEIWYKDMMEKLLDEEKKGYIEIFRYPEKPTNIPQDDTDLIYKSIFWSLELHPTSLLRLKFLHPALHKTAINIIKDNDLMVEHAKKWINHFNQNDVFQNLNKYFPKVAQKLGRVLLMPNP